MLYAVLIVILVAADQVVKYLVRSHIALGETIDFIPRLLGLTYVQNTGAAFSLFNEHTWVLTLVSAAACLALAAALWKPVFRRPAGKLTLALLLAGAVGNLIDRALFGFVTDMFKTLFMNFAIFNVADICVVVGGIALIVYMGLFYDKLEGTHDADPSDR